MSRPSMMLPIRALSRSTQHSRTQTSQWICQRCLTTATPATPAAAITVPITSEIQTNLVNKPRASHILSSLPDQTSSSPTPQNLSSAPHNIGDRSEGLSQTERLLQIPLPHRTPDAYLQHATSDLLSAAEREQKKRTKARGSIIGVVVSSGKMEKTVKVRVNGQQWNKRVHKYLPSHENHLVHDHNSSLLTGDVVELQRLRFSKHVRHAVKRIIAPFGTPIADRPPIVSADEWLAAYKEKRVHKLHRRELRQRAALGDADAITELQAMGLDPGRGVAPGKISKAALEGRKGQKLPEGVLPGGSHEVGPIGLRAKHNKEKALDFEEQAVENLVQAQEREADLKARNLATSSVV